MKSYEQMSASVLARRDEYMAEKHRQKQYMKKSAIAFSCCFAIFLAFGAVNKLRVPNVQHGCTAELTATEQSNEPTIEYVQNLAQIKTESDSSVQTDAPKITVDVPPNEYGEYREAVDPDAMTDSFAQVFCGAYIDDAGSYNILLTANSAENRALICEELGISETDAIFSEAEYTLAYLTELQESISLAMMDKELTFVISSALMESSNCIEVVVTTQDEEELQKLYAFDTLGGAIELEFSSFNQNSIDALISKMQVD